MITLSCFRVTFSKTSSRRESYRIRIDAVLFLGQGQFSKRFALGKLVNGVEVSTMF